MPSQSWDQIIANITAAAAAVTGTAEAIVVPDTIIPANYIYPGKTLRLRLSGIISNVVTTPGTITFRLRWGGVAGTLVVASAAISQNTAAQTNDQWELDLILSCYTVGTSGTIIASGTLLLGNIVSSSAGQPQLVPVSGNAAVSVDTTTQKNLSVTAQFSVTGNSIQCQQYTVEDMN